MLFCDADALMHLPKASVERILRKALHLGNNGRHTSGTSSPSIHIPTLPNLFPVIFAAESESCYPSAVYHNASTSAYWPQACLSSSSYFGTARAVMLMLNQSCGACRTGGGVEEVHRKFHSSYGELINPSWFIDDQVEMAKIYVAGLRDPASIAPLALSLDSSHRVSLQVSTFDARGVATPPATLQVQPNGLFHSRPTDTAPAFVLFDGPSKAFKGPHSPAALMSAIRKSYDGAPGNDHAKKERITFVGADFTSAVSGSLQAACSAGEQLDGQDAVRAARFLRSLQDHTFVGKQTGNPERWRDLLGGFVPPDPIRDIARARVATPQGWRGPTMRPLTIRIDGRHDAASAPIRP